MNERLYIRRNDQKMQLGCKKKLTLKFVDDPMIFFSEKDFHWIFCHYLIEVDKNFFEAYETGYTDNSGNRIFRNIVLHQEYGVGENIRIDVVILDPSRFKEVDKFDIKKSHESEEKKKFLDPLIALEFKTRKGFGNTTKSLEKCLEDDCEKLLERGGREKWMLIYYTDKPVKAKAESSSYKSRLKAKNSIASLRKAFNVCLSNKKYSSINFLCVVYSPNEDGYNFLGKWKNENTDANLQSKWTNEYLPYKDKEKLKRRIDEFFVKKTR
jgi:hypothetical protein